MDFKIVLILVVLTSQASAQENAGSSIAKGLIECYNETAIPGITIPDNRIPTTINALIDIIRKVEDAHPKQDAKRLAVSLLQRFRQDGIFKTGRETDYGLPYSPRRWDSFKNNVMLKYLIPSATGNFNNDSLTPMERCSFHYMISSTIDLRVRDDESDTCIRTSRYVSRIKRNSKTKLSVEKFEISEGNRSQCPLELGVVSTQWGAVKIGNVLNGIATGLNYEQVNDCDGCDNRLASTITGELTEAALYQANENVEIGASGEFNSTLNPKYLFLSTNKKLQLTDSEIRGSLDGLYISKKVADWKNKFSDIKISQILDLYYSSRGVFSEEIRACNRTILQTEFTTTAELKEQTQKFMPLLNIYATFDQTVKEDKYDTLSTKVVESFNNKFTKIGDVQCTNDIIERAAADITIFIDGSWEYSTIQPVLSYILDKIDVNKFETTYTVLSGRDSSIIVNKTNHLVDFHEYFTRNLNLEDGFDYTTVFEKIENIAKDNLNNKTNMGGRSNIILMATNTKPTDTERTFVKHRRETFIDDLPSDLTLLILGVGSTSDYTDLVATPTDIIILPTSTKETDLDEPAQKIIDRIKAIPRAVINPNCGASLSGGSSTFSLEQFVEPQGFNNYRISPAYFFSGGDDRKLTVQEASYGSIIVCMGRESRPTNQTGTCKTLTGSSTSYDVKSSCSDTLASCEPIYLTIEGVSSSVKCKDALCRFPDSIKYTVKMENVGCSSAAKRIMGSFAILTILLYFLKF